MGQPGAPVVLSAGSSLTFAGLEWTVESCEPHLGQVHLARPDGQRLSTTVRALVSGPGRGQPAGPAAASQGRHPGGLDDLTGQQRELVMMRYAHLMEGQADLSAVS